MSTQGEPFSEQLTPPQTAAMLQRMLDAVERDDRNRWVEIACAVVLSLTMLASAWCAYQANLWSGVQTFRLAAANKAGRESSKATLAALQIRAFDAAMLINYLQAQTQDNQRLEKILHDRFRPEMKTAVEAWLKTDPFHDPAAPPSPFKMVEYVQQELVEAQHHDELSAREQAGAEEANETGDTYVLLTVAFASVLFFGGIGGSVQSRRLRISFVVIALMLFTVTMITLGTMPVCTH
ncbi:MAG: hypothetical protein NTY19_39970 [Planctomycetota bacterium]|nr:hypothetical protein [Planctomycetota bacterium]